MPQRSRFSCVCFDCDSTLTRVEGIDELARLRGCEAEIAPLTRQAMDGSLTLEEVYARRLERVRPDREALRWLGDSYVENIVQGARETIDVLRQGGAIIHIVSGGLRQPVLALASALGIEPACVHAVEVYLDDSGAYRSFDAASPLTRSDGKAVVCRHLAARYGSVALVGDGVSDLAARDGGAFIVGFGGVIAREKVAECADYFVAAPTLTATLAALLTSDGRGVG